MKVIISEKQLGLLSESDFLTWVKRRETKDFLEKYIIDGEINYPTLCDDFDDEYLYADNVIDFAIDNFLEEFTDDYYDLPEYNDVRDRLLSKCREWFEWRLLDIYRETCSEY